MEMETSAEQEARALEARCSACRDKFTELRRAAGCAVYSSAAEDFADDRAPDPSALAMHHKLGHEEEIRRLCPKIGLRYL